MTGKCYENAHRALADVKAIATFFFHYWELRKGYIYEVTRSQQEQHETDRVGTDDNTPPPPPPPQQDDNDSCEEEEDSHYPQSSEEEDDDLEQQIGVQLGDEWDGENYDHSPFRSITQIQGTFFRVLLWEGEENSWTKMQSYGNKHTYQGMAANLYKNNH